MKINITKKQYRDLIEMLYIADWMANAIRTGAPDDPFIEKYHRLEQYFYSFYKSFDAEDIIEFSREFDKYFPTVKLEEESTAREAIEAYDEHEFWEELFYRLVERDMINKYGASRCAQMDWRERIQLEEPFRKKWDKELEKHGLTRLYAES